MTEFKIRNRVVGEGHPTLIVAEEGQANQGDIALAKKMCVTAAEAGADGIEYQFFLADHMYIQGDPGYAIYRNRELEFSQIQELIELTHAQGMFCQVAGLSPTIIDVCTKAGVDVFVVNASDLNNPYIIDAVVASEKPFWLATLMATLDEIDWAVDYVRSKGARNFGLLHGQHVMSSDHSRGVPPELLQLDCIEMLKKRHNIVTGFVDHTATTFVPAIAAAKGAALITKHLAPKTGWKGPDWVVCLDPEEWRNCKEILVYANTARGASKEISHHEGQDRSLHRRSLYTNAALPKGHVLRREDLLALRPGQGGMDPRQLDLLVGKPLNKAMSSQVQIQIQDIENQMEKR